MFKSINQNFVLASWLTALLKRIFFALHLYIMNKAIHTISGSFCAGTKTIADRTFTNKNKDFGANAVTERSCSAPIPKVESHISDKCSHYTYRIDFPVGKKGYPV